MFGGSSLPAEQQQADNVVASQANESSPQSNAWGPRGCETDAKTFTKCLDENQGNMQICGWYLDQLVTAKTRDYFSPRSDDDILYRKLASKQPVSTRDGRVSNDYGGWQEWKE